MIWSTAILGRESRWPENNFSLGFIKAQKIQFERVKWKIIVNISYSAWNNYWVCNIKKTLLSQEEAELVEKQESRWFILVGFTDESGIVPKYITDAIKIEHCNINLRNRILERWKSINQKLVFVKENSINLVYPESARNRFRRMVNEIMNY